MQKETYQKRLEKIKKSKIKFNILKVTYKFLPLLMMIVYPVTVTVKGFLSIDTDFILMIAVPAATLLLITLLRKVNNRARPYEKFRTPPLFDRDGSGESFPSRHTASAFIIAMSSFALCPYLGALLLFLAFIIGVTRILSGVHYLTDVLAGMLISLVIGITAFVII